MNKKLLALAIGAAVAMPVSAIAAPTLYGKMNVTLEKYEDEAATDQFQLDSNDSRLGVKGDFDLEVGGLKALYQAEYGIRVDDGTGPFSQRNIFAGLQGGFGTLKAGMFDSPLKTSQGKIDQFNDLDGDIKYIMAGEIRAKNIIQYSTPTLADMFTLNIAVLPGEGAVVDGEAQDGLADASSISLEMKSGDLYAALAMDKDMVDNLEADDLAASAKADMTRLTVAYKADAIELGALYQMADEAIGDGSDTSVVVSGAYTMDRTKLKLQYGMTEGDVGGEEITTLSFGVDYKLAKASKVFAYYTTVEKDLAATEDTNIALGLEHNF